MSYGNPNLLAADSSTFEGNAHNWTAGGNTTLSVVSGQYMSGSYSLRFTATAAGSITGTTPRVTGVTAGLEYVVRSPIRRNTTTAGQVATLTVTWYNATSGGASLGTSVSALTLTGAAAGWFYYNHPVVVGTAPVGALSCTITLSVSGLAAAEYVNTDDVYFGAAQVRPNNIYGYNTASIEQDTSGWKVDSGVMARGAWNLAGGLGYYALEVTSTAAGIQEIRTNSFVAVTPGKEYTSYALVRSPSATTWLCEFRWYDAGSNQVGAVTQTPYAIAANASTWVGVTATAPTGVNATQCKVFIRPMATAAGQLFVLEDAQFYVSPNLANNLLSYAEYSAEGVLPAWTLDNGTTSLYQVTSGITDGLFALKVTPSVPGTVTASLDRLVPVVPGTTYQVSAVLYRHSTDAAQKVISSVRTRIDWYDAAGILYLADNPDQFYSTEQAADWYAQINTETRTCPEGAAYAKVGFEVNSDNPLVDCWFVDNVSLIQATAEYTLATSNDTGCVTLTINYVPPVSSSNSNVTIRRMDESGKAASMRAYGRSWDLAPNPYSTIVVEDYEAPLGSRVWYSVQWSSSTGATKGARLFTQTVGAPTLDDGDYAWFKSPGVPALNTTVMMEAPLKWSRAARSARYDVVGRKNPVHITGARAGRTSSITVLVWDPEGNALFDSLLDAGTAALIQAMPGYGLDGNLYVSIGDVDVEPLSPDAREDGWRWTLAITEVDRPDGGLQGSAANTWNDILISSAYSTWEDLFNSHETWTDVLTEG
ncbi:hypothetical protein ACFW81_02595 [Streptomyces angustmyceticus]|uniref:hypothetical protein n=1 Tax=Streptomyces angustmyceticus TaxID=285578 RepID=UPI00367D362F